MTALFGQNDRHGRDSCFAEAVAATLVVFTGVACAGFFEQTIRAINSSLPGRTGGVVARTMGESMEWAMSS